MTPADTLLGERRGLKRLAVREQLALELRERATLVLVCPRERGEFTISLDLLGPTARDALARALGVTQPAFYVEVTRATAGAHVAIRGGVDDPETALAAIVTRVDDAVAQDDLAPLLDALRGHARPLLAMASPTSFWPLSPAP